MRLRQVINQTMEVDIPQYANMNASTGRKLKKLLAVIAQSVPFKPVMDSLATVIGVSRNVLPDYFLYMEQAGMIGQLRDDTGGIREAWARSKRCTLTTPAWPISVRSESHGHRQYPRDVLLQSDASDDRSHQLTYQ